MSEMSAGRSLSYFATEVGLTKKQRAFAEAYLSDPQRDQGLAAKKAGYANPLIQSYQLLKNDKIRQFLELADKKGTQLAERKLQIAVMKTPELKARLSDQGRGSLVQFFNPDGSLDLERLKTEDRGHLVKKLMTISSEDRTVVKAEPADPQGALKELASIYGLTKDKQQQAPQLNFMHVVQQMAPDERKALSSGLDVLYRAMLSTGQVIDVEVEE